MTTPDGLTPATLVTDMARHLSEHARHEVGGIPCIVTSEWELEAVERQAGQRALDTVADRIASGAWDEDLFRPVIEKGLARAREQAVARHVRETGCEGLRDALDRLAWCAVRYGLGRRTYVTAHIAESVARVKDSLREDTRRIIVTDIDRAEERGPDGLGDSVDAGVWRGLRAALASPATEEVERG